MKRYLIVLVALVATATGAYAAGAATHSDVVVLSAHRLQSLQVVRNTAAESFTIHGTDAPETPVPGARLVVRVRTGEQAILDIRFQPLRTASNFLGDILVDGIAVAPTGLGMFSSQGDPVAASERIAGPLAAGQHTITVVAQTPFSGVTWNVTLPGFTLVAEQAEARQ